MSLDKIDLMFTCNTHISDTLVIKQSKFIAHIMPYSQFETILAALKEEHPKARHFVTAFRYLNVHDQIVEGSSDDGEPKGTSGKPSLHVLQGYELINTAVIIVRYFGGTKLGTGGLVRAYSDAVNQVIEHTALDRYEKKIPLQLRCSYDQLGRVEYTLDKAHVTIIDKLFEASDVRLLIEGTQEQLDASLAQFERNISVIPN
jgi:uncharacterized YigZ family protein